jgi:hypothetical protein
MVLYLQLLIFWRHFIFLTSLFGLRQSLKIFR